MKPTLGILMLDTRFPRSFGDAGNAATWPFAVRTRVVGTATPERVVRDKAEGLVDAFIAAGRALAAEGVAGITTTCGFLCLHQATIAAALPVPFASSSLLQVPLLARVLPRGRRVGILTIDRSSLTHEHLSAVGIDPETPLEGIAAASHLARVLIGNEPLLDPVTASADLIAAGRKLVDQHRDVGAIVLECANMPPYAAQLGAALGLPVYDWYSMVTWFVRGLEPRSFVAPAIDLCLDVA